MRLYYNPMSANARRAVMTAIQLGAPVELVLVDLANGEQKGAAYLAMNPNGRVPTLEDNGFHLTESHAIMAYLADLTPGQTLYPQPLQARADVNRWLFWNAHHFAPAISVLNWENLVKPLLRRGDPDPREIERGERLVREFARVLDAHLEGKEWIAQGHMTLADLAVATPLMTLHPAKLPVTDCPHMLAWFSRMQSLDAWKKTAPPSAPGDRSRS